MGNRPVPICVSREGCRKPYVCDPAGCCQLPTIPAAQAPNARGAFEAWYAEVIGDTLALKWDGENYQWPEVQILWQAFRDGGRRAPATPIPPTSNQQGLYRDRARAIIRQSSGHNPDVDWDTWDKQHHALCVEADAELASLRRELQTANEYIASRAVETNCNQAGATSESVVRNSAEGGQRAAEYTRPWIGTASMYASQHRLAVSTDWCVGWNACLTALEEAGCRSAPGSSPKTTSPRERDGVFDGYGEDKS